MITHIIDNGIVVNSICATVEETQLAYPNMTCIAAEGHGGIGWRWDEEKGFFPPEIPPAPPTIPISITPRQGYIILSRYGILEAVKNYFAALDGQEGEEAKIELEFAQEWKRTWPTLINAAHDFGLTDAQIDQMFIEASII